jgi:hypothetical protein
MNVLFGMPHQTGGGGTERALAEGASKHSGDSVARSMRMAERVRIRDRRGGHPAVADHSTVRGWWGDGGVVV